MAAPDDNLSDDIMADIINVGTNADVDDTSQYFAEYPGGWRSTNRRAKKY